MNISSRIIFITLFLSLFLFSTASAQITQTLKPGDKNQEVTLLQKLLNTLGKNVTLPGAETNFFGRVTASVVQAFQCENRIVCAGTPGTTGFGMIGPKTRSLLNSVYYSVGDLLSHPSGQLGQVISSIETTSPTFVQPTFVEKVETEWNSATSPKTTSTFSVKAGDVLVGYAVSENGGKLGISGGSLAWSSLESISITHAYSAVRIWTATASSDQSMTVSFTGNNIPGDGFFGGSVLVFRGSAGIGSSVKAKAKGDPSVTISTTQANSAIVAVSGDWSATDGSSRTWKTNAGPFSEQTYSRSSSNYAAYGGYHANAGSKGSYAIGLSSPSGQTYSIAAVEVKGTARAILPPPDTQSPTTPVSLSTSVVSQSQINMTWSASSDNTGVTSYNIFRNGAQVGTATSPSYSDTGLVAGTLYSYTIQAVDAAGNVSPLSSAMSATTQPSVTLPPTTVVPLMPSLTFEAEAGLIQPPFIVSAGTIIQNTSNIGNLSSSGKASYRFNITTSGYYRVKAVVSAPTGESDSLYVNIDGVSTDPTMIWDISPWTSTLQEKTLTWRGTGNYVTPQFSPKTFLLSAGEHTLIIQGREAGTRVDRITIEPVNTTLPPVVVTDMTAPTTPTGLVATAISSSQVDLKWNASTDASRISGYRIFQNGILHKTTSSTGTTYSNTGLLPSTQYFYTVSAIDASANTNVSAQSTSATAVTKIVSMIPPSTKFTIGARAQTSSNLNVRSTPSVTGSLLGTQVVGALGTITGGPITADGYSWWNVNYDNGADGWSIEDSIGKTTVVTPPTNYTLSITKGGTGTGTVSGGSISCGSTCSASLSAGTVTLTASPAVGHSIIWSGCSSANGNTCTVNLSANTTVTATFNSSGAGISCDQTTLQNAINAASSGATITCNIGNWSGSISIPNTKGITINGNGSNHSGLFTLNPGSVSSRITNFRFTSNSNLLNIRSGSLTSAPWRVDNNTFTGSGHFLIHFGVAPGLFDHNNFTSLGGANEFIHNEAYGAGDTTGWTNSLTPGAFDSVYLEDNTFTTPTSQANNAWIQSYYGARMVHRFNTFNYTRVDAHGTAGNVGARWWEFYNNNFVQTGGNAGGHPMNLRAGSGIIFGNTKSGSATTGTIGMCEENSGYPASYQIGRGQNQILYPAYVWNDSFTIGPNDCEAPEIDNMVQLNRDVYSSAGANCPAGGNCATGVGTGTTLPTSCTTDTGFWKTDAGSNWNTTNGSGNDGALYKCTSTNNWTKYYTPFKYPYPLTTNGLPNPGSITPPPIVIPSTFTLSSLKSGTGLGTITSSTGGVNCGATCTTTSLTSGTLVTLTATPIVGSTFSGWSGACTGTGSCSVSLTSNTSVTATFTLNTVTLPPSTKFTIGSRAKTTANLNVRSTPSSTGSLLGTQALGVLGTITAGPITAAGYSWWNVNYDNGADGWSTENFMIKTTIVTPPPVNGTTFYIRDGGTGNCSDWANACDVLPTTLIRGATYYIADGTYPGRIFNTAVNGAQLITIKKATAADHGTAAGWNSIYGDGQAVFTSRLEFSTSNWVLNGQVGGGPGSWTSGHGFKIIQTEASPVILTTNGANISNFTFAHVELQGNRNNSSGGSNGQDAFAFADNDNITISYVYSHDMGRTHLWTWGGSDNLTVEYSYFGHHVSSSAVHSEVAALDEVNNVTFKYNVFTHTAGTGGLIINGNDIKIYGNVFYNRAGDTWDHGNGVIGTWTSSTLTNTKVYNNSFINIGGFGPVFGTLYTAPATGNEVRGNLFYGITASLGGLGGLFPTHSYNHYINTSVPGSGVNTTTGTVDPFVDVTNLNFALTANTPAGDTTVPAQYRTDMFGRVGSTRGAVQF